MLMSLGCSEPEQSPSPWIFPTLEILWGVITFSTAAVKNVNQLYGIRALIGFLEAPAYAGTHFYLGSWYKKEEIFKRAGLWFCSNFIANIISGYLQAAAYRNLNGVHGLAGWRWLFIVDGAYTVPIALIGYLTFPGIPSSRKKWVFSEEEWALAKSRMPKDHSQAGKYTWSTVKRGLTSRIWYIGTTSYVCLALGPWWTTTNFSLWLKSEKTYSVELINILPTFYSVIGVFTCFFGTVLAGNNILKPWLVFFVTQGILIFSLILLTVWYIPAGLKLFAFYLGGFCGPTSPILYSWVNITLRNDPELRSFTMASMMTAGFIGNLWIPLLTFPTKSAPRFPKGYPTAIGLNTFFLFSWGYGFWLYRHANTQVGNDDNAVTSSDSDAKSVEEKSVGERDEVPQLNAVANRVQ
ncbi:MFS general substrate transporter [Pseudohyphozyma bogoriensis]|nr:MFS general substrate transporter [Pseudohyphozyma bogoriensis]